MDTTAYRNARLGADVHLQVWLDHRQTWPNTAMIVGRVVRIFADRGRRLTWGGRISFAQPFTSRQAPDAGPDPQTWARARAAEAYLLASADGDWRVTCDQFTLLLRPTVRPVNPAQADRGWFAQGPGL